MKSIKLKNGKTYNIGDEGCEYSISMIFDTLEESLPVIEEFTEDNLSSFELFDEDGNSLGAYINKYLTLTSNYKLDDGRTRVIFYFSNVDMVAKRLDALEANQTIQEEAIIELASLIG